MANIRIDDLPPLEALSPEEQERILGAGRPSTQLGLEALEDRQLLTAGVMASVANGVLTVTGTSQADQIHIFQDKQGDIRVESVAPTQPRIVTWNGEQLEITQLVHRQTFSLNTNGTPRVVDTGRVVGNSSMFDRIVIDGLAGNDAISVTGVGAKVFVEVDGGKGDDTITGGTGFSSLDGGVGNDLIQGRGGNDCLFGGAGNDTLRGGAGHDTLFGGANEDRLEGEAGNDSLTGDAGNDQLFGGDGHDFLSGSAGHDSLTGNAGDDTLMGDVGNDQLAGDAGVDCLSGGAGNDTLRGGTENNRLFGDAGNDRLDGDYGNDTLDGGIGNDTLDGWEGDDQLEGGGGHDSLYAAEGNDTVSGGAGNDTLSGNAGNDQLEGGIGNDLISGDEDDDTLSGGEGKDTLSGGTGNDLLDGGAGKDRLSGDEGADILSSGNKEDQIVGIEVADVIDGVDGVRRALEDAGFKDADISAIGEAVRAAMHGPEAKFLKIRGHTFHVKATEKYIKGDVITYTGRISHVLNNRTDNQIDYTIVVKDGQIVGDPSIRIERGGITSFVKAAISIAVYLVHVPVNLSAKLLADHYADKIMARIEDKIDGKWESMARFLVQEISGAATHQYAEDIAARNNPQIGMKNMNGLQQLIDKGVYGGTSDTVKVFGHEFIANGLKPKFNDDGSVTYKGTLEHYLSIGSNDRVNIEFTVKDGQVVGELDYDIQYKGVGKIIRDVAREVINIFAAPIKVLPGVNQVLDYAIDKALDELHSRIVAAVDGTWESVAVTIASLMAQTAAMAQNQK